MKQQVIQVMVGYINYSSDCNFISQRKKTIIATYLFEIALNASLKYTPGCC